MKDRKTPGVLGALLALMAIPALADTTLEMSVHNGGTQRQTFQVSNGHLRVTTAGRQGKMVLLFREGADQYQVLNSGTKEVMTITLQQMQQMMQQMAGAMQQMQSMMGDRMKNLPPEQRAQMAQMMAQSAGGGSHPKPQIRATGRSDKVGAWSCKIVEVVKEGQVTSELCVARTRALGIPERDHQTMNSFFKFMARMTALRPQGMGQGRDEEMPFLGPDALSGVPVRAIHKHGGMQSRMQLTKVSTAKLNGSLFKVPAGYKPMQMPMMPGQ